MKSIKYLALPFLSVALVMTGCASRKPQRRPRLVQIQAR